MKWLKFIKDLVGAALAEFVVKDLTGAALAEFVVSVPFLLVFIVEVVNGGLIISAYHQIYGILNTGLLYAIRNPGDLGLIKRQMTSASPMNPLSVNVTQFCECPDGSLI